MVDFRHVCEAAAERWEVPALAVGTRRSEVGRRSAATTTPVSGSHRSRSRSRRCWRSRCSISTTPTGVWPADVRVRHLLSHTCGFDCELADGDNEQYGDGDDALPACVAELPGIRRFVGVETAWSYANTGYWLAGHLAAERAGSTFEDALTEHVLRPAGLEATPSAGPTSRAPAATRNPSPYPRARRPSGGLVSNVPDLRASPNGLATAGTPQRVVHGRPPGGVYGLGLFGERVGGVDVWGHAGSWGGFQSSFLTVPSYDAYFVALTNSSFGAKALAEIEDAFFERVIGERTLEAAVRRTRAGRARPLRRDLREQRRAHRGRRSRRRARAARPTARRSSAARSATRCFEVPDGPHVSERFDFPLDGLRALRLASCGARRVIHAAVAAGHPATAAAGAEILADGGSAADAAVAACLASCVAETVMTGLLGGGHAIYFDAASGSARLLDCFVAVPSGEGAPMDELEVPFGEELVHYAVGASSCAVPGVPAGLDALWRAHGRLPWARLVEPALQLARSGVVMPPAHASCLAMLAPVMTMREGAAIYAPGGRCSTVAACWCSPVSSLRSSSFATRARASVYRGTIADALRRAGRGTRRRTPALRSRDVRSRCGRRRSRSRSPAVASRRAPVSAASPRRSRGSTRRAVTRRCSQRSTTGLRSRAHDEPHRRRRGRVRVRPDDESRPRLRRLPARSRPAPEQHARRDRPRPRAARPGRADGEHDGADARLRRRSPRARARCRRWDASTHRARRRARPDPA